MVLKKKNKSSEKKKEKVSTKMKEEIAKELISKIPKTKRKKPKKKGPGRPVKIDDAILEKLKACFAVGMSDIEACYFCKIAEKTLYNYQDKNKEFIQEKEILKKSITLQAKFNIGRAIKTEEAKPNGGTSNSWKRLEKKDPDFKDKLQIDGTIISQMSEEDKEIYNQILQKNLKLGSKQMKS